jgi:hypothetical protein
MTRPKHSANLPDLFDFGDELLDWEPYLPGGMIGVSPPPIVAMYQVGMVSMGRWHRRRRRRVGRPRFDVCLRTEVGTVDIRGGTFYSLRTAKQFCERHARRWRRRVLRSGNYEGPAPALSTLRFPPPAKT